MQSTPSIDWQPRLVVPSLISSDAVPMQVIDQAVRRVLRTKTLAGMLDYLPSGNPDYVNSKERQQLSLEARRKSLVLLKNQDNILPERLGLAPLNYHRMCKELGLKKMIRTHLKNALPFALRRSRLRRDCSG